VMFGGVSNMGRGALGAHSQGGRSVTNRYGQDLGSAGAGPAGSRTGRCGQHFGSAGAGAAGSRTGLGGQDLGSADVGPRGSRSLYETLGVAPDATVHEIRSAYRQLALRYHPDKNPGDDGQMFVAVAQAFEVLSDSARRARYDRSGDDCLNQLDLVSAEELMEAFFAQCKKTPDSVTILSITPQEAQRGARKMVWIKRIVVDEHGCQRQEELEVPVTVPAGCQNKHRITLQRLSNEEPGKVPGDYTFVIKVNAAFQQPASGKDSADPHVSHTTSGEQRAPHRGAEQWAPEQPRDPLNRGNSLSRNMAQHQSAAEQHGSTAYEGTVASVQITGPLDHAGRFALDSGTPYAAAGQSSPFGQGVAVLDGPTNYGSTHAPIRSACDEAAWNSAF